MSVLFQCPERVLQTGNPRAGRGEEYQRDIRGLPGLWVVFFRKRGSPERVCFYLHAYDMIVVGKMPATSVQHLKYFFADLVSMVTASKKIVID